MDDSALELRSGSGQPPAPETPGQSLALPAPQGVAPPQLSEMGQHFASAQDVAQARYSKMQTATETLEKVREVMDQLVNLGDTVTQDDIVKAGGGLVASGLGAAAVAGILADMPEGGAALQQWVQMHDQQVSQREAQAQRALALTRHELGVQALRSVIGHSAEGRATAPPPPSPLALEPTSDAS